MTDDAFLDRFLRSEIPHADWTHLAHLRVAFALVKREPDHDRALGVMRDGIVRLNAAHGKGGRYLEDVTETWLRTVRNASADHETFESFVGAHPEFLDKRHVLKLMGPRG